ncbi:hypothetical protein T281_12015 [Rhodomicrobium udaipurense JA643]|nr:hypothetical protein T281_12015 [Rhodomicrobium udaipurense JA643]
MFFDHISRNAEPSGDLTIRHTVQATEDEDFLTPIRKCLNGLCQQKETLAPVHDALLRGCIQRLIEAIFGRKEEPRLGDSARARPARDRLCYLEQIGLRVIDDGLLRRFQKPQERLLGRVGGVIWVAQPTQEKTAQAWLFRAMEVTDHNSEG